MIVEDEFPAWLRAAVECRRLILMPAIEYMRREVGFVARGCQSVRPPVWFTAARPIHPFANARGKALRGGKDWKGRLVRCSPWCWFSDVICVFSWLRVSFVSVV